MQFELMMRKERKLGHAEGKAESVLDFLSEYGEVPEELRNQILQETDLAILSKWLKLAARVDSVRQFCDEM